MLDGRGGLSEADAEALALVRETGCPLIMAVNKIDRPGQEAEASEFYALGGDELFFISAAHGRGVDELLDQVVARLPEREGAAAASSGFEARADRPSQRRQVVAPQSPVGIRARDRRRHSRHDARSGGRAASSHGRDVLLIDTAGIRRPPKVEGELEHHSVGRAIETIRRANVVLLVIDASEGITDQDARLARLVDTSDRAMVIVCNKWDVAAKQGRKVATFVRDAHERYPFLEYASMVFTSAVTGDGVDGIIPAATQAGDSWRAVFQTSRLNRTLAEATAAMDPPQVDRRRLNLMYVTQVGNAPPRLRFFTNVERGIPAHYVRFIETRFRKSLGLVGTPLRLDFKRTGRSWVQGAPPRPTRGKPRNRPAPRTKPARA